jgi:hypothetical protein
MIRKNRSRTKGKKPFKKHRDGYTGERRKKLKEKALLKNKESSKKWKDKSQLKKWSKSSVQEGKSLDDLKKEFMKKFLTQEKEQ